jgi:hypothetical protein
VTEEANLKSCEDSPPSPLSRQQRLAFSYLIDRKEAIERAALIWALGLIAPEGVDLRQTFKPLPWIGAVPDATK